MLSIAAHVLVATIAVGIVAFLYLRLVRGERGPALARSCATAMLAGATVATVSCFLSPSATRTLYIANATLIALALLDLAFKAYRRRKGSSGGR